MIEVVGEVGSNHHQIQALVHRTLGDVEFGEWQEKYETANLNRTAVPSLSKTPASASTDREKFSHVHLM